MKSIAIKALKVTGWSALIVGCVLVAPYVFALCIAGGFVYALTRA